MAENNKTFILVGKFDDQITPALKKLNRTINAFDRKLNRGFSQTFKDLNKEMREFAQQVDRFGKVFDRKSSKGVDGLTASLEAAAKAAGKVQDRVSAIGDGLHGLDGIAESLEGAARAAGRAQDEVLGIGEAAGKAQRQADDLMTTLLKAEGLSKFGDAMAQGFARGFGMITSTARKGAGFIAQQYRAAMEDEMSDIKATTSVQGSFTQAGFKGGERGGGLTYEEAGKFYKQFDMQIAEMIRTSAAPTSKVVELQRQTMDTLGPLLLAAEGVKKGTNVKDITPQTIKKVSTTYGGMLEQIALLAQGTGTATFRVAQGVEGLIKSGKIDTTMDFFTDNVLLMQALQDAGFAGGGAARGGRRVATITNEADRLKALQKALETAQSREGIKKMSESLTGSIQGLMDTLTNPSVGVFGMATTFSEKEQKGVDKAIQKVYTQRIDDLKREYIKAKDGSLRKKQLLKDIEREEAEVNYLTKEGASQITSPFKAFNLMFGKMIRSLTEALNAIGPIWNRFAVTAITWTDKFLRPLDIALKNVASDMRADFKKTGGKNQLFNIGRIFGEIYKFIGAALGDLAKQLTDPKGALGKSQSQFMQGFQAAFKEPGAYEKARKGISDGISALIRKIFSVLMSIVASEEFRPILIPLVAAMFGPPMISAIISGITPLLITGAQGMFTSLFAEATAVAATASAAPAAAAPAAGVVEGLLLGGSATAGATAGAGATGAAGAGGIMALLANPLTVSVAVAAALAVAAKITEPVVNTLAPKLQASAAAETNKAGKFAQAGDAGNMFGSFIKGEMLNVANDFMLGFNRVFAGIADFIVGVFSDPAKVEAGINKIFEGLWRLFTMIGHLILGVAAAVPGFLVLVNNAIKNLFIGTANAILGALSKVPGVGGIISAISGLFGAVTDKLNWVRSHLPPFLGGISPQGGQPPPPRGAGHRAYGHSGFTSLGNAINMEMRNKPAGSNLVIANDSETIIPAAGGLDMGGGLKGLIQVTVNGFNSLINTVKTAQERSTQSQKITAAQTNAIINRSIQVNMAGDRQIMAAIKAVSAAGGFGGLGGGALGSAKGNLGAAAALARSMGLTMTSFTGGKHAPGSYHYQGRAMDFSDSTGPSPGMMKFAQTMVAKYGSSLTELIYTPLGYAIKNGQKVAPYAAGQHYNHVHVAFGRGPGNPTLFSNANAAMAYERMMAPSGARVSTVTANSSEFGSGNTYNVNPNITISGYNQDPEALARTVWQYTFEEIQRMKSVRPT